MKLQKHPSAISSISILLFVVVVMVSCKISYKFSGSNIDYNRTKSISIVDFTNVAELVYPPLTQQFSQKLRDAYLRGTRLQVLKRGGDMHLEGEITEYFITPLGVGTDNLASQTKLTMTINVRFTNHKNPQDDFEKKYTAFQTFDSSRMLSEVQDILLKSMIEEIVDNIYNETVAKW